MICPRSIGTRFQDQHPCKNLGIEVGTCNPSAGKKKEEDFMDFLANKPSSKRDSVSKNKGESGKDTWCQHLSSTCAQIGTCTCHMHAYIHATHMETLHIKIFSS